MNPFNNKVVLITGASSGIGKALAIQLADTGVTLILAARRMDELNLLKEECEKKGASCTCHFIDMADPKSIAGFVEKVSSQFSKIDVQINNAGMSQRSQAEVTAIEVDRKIMEVNFFGQVHITKLLWPLLIKSAHANIVLISSVVGTFGFPQRSAYAASKHALEGFFESWMLENKRENIHFTTIAPGRVYTHISYAALTADGSMHKQMDQGQINGIKAEVCAQKIIRAILKNKRKVYIVQYEMILIILRKCLPYLFFQLVRKLKLS
ncbi:MAG: SDR family oxidoreductase [Bacteroidota bacterium]|nr:SDR family oxidoreductase [Bacteroidota bacterium]